MGDPLFCKLLGDPGFVPPLGTLISLDFVEGFSEIFFTMSNCDFQSLNWNFRIKNLAKSLESWKFLTLSLKGKSMIINTLALSGLWYTGSVVPLPAWAEKRINRIIFDFLWSGKNEQIKREVCYLPYELGGFKVVNVALKCKALIAKSAVFITDSHY